MWWIILVLVVVMIILWWLLRQNAEATEAPTHELAEEAHEVEAHPEPEAIRSEPAVVETAKPDDLTIIEGIGPKIASIFQQAGITTFAQLAQEDPAHLKQILENAGLRLGDPTTWTHQAKLAAEGDWDGLNALQDSLKGGRQV